MGFGNKNNQNQGMEFDNKNNQNDNMSKNLPFNNQN